MPRFVPIEEQLRALTLKMWDHADRCRACRVPIIDEEGNPGLAGEACRTGADLILRHRDLEGKLFVKRR